jgi:hypothetical protein
VTVRSGSATERELLPACVCVTGTMNGVALSTTYRWMPCAIRRSVASASGLVRSKIERPRSDQSMHSAAVRQGFWPLPGTLACVGSGHTIGCPSQRATTNRRLRMVGAP